MEAPSRWVVAFCAISDIKKFRELRTIVNGSEFYKNTKLARCFNKRLRFKR